ncbi:hypothetical protein RN001_008009 [Aquatica leii]|uniref:Carboxylesterase type B domain-containing protein n=1 Tax=Aquatica leii TaxID=1421715 RepID=A0AAN7PA88_9COLE|nr:hypothetical protein RN001_008009 [Aquatica leii]
MQTYIVILNIFILVLVFVDAQSDPPVVFLKNGLSVIGTVNKTVDENQIYYAFRGIPFAEAPLEDLRFRPPVPLPQNLSGHVIDASRDRSACIQFQENPVEGSEDCLYINVYTPQFVNVSKLLPVMVWIYGGGFYKGNSKYSSFGPDYLLEENVTVVTFNYRLGVYGFLSTEDYVSPGNYGLKDQVLALNWVQENIIYFGGDKTQVTIFGESAGASSISYLTQTPLTRGLFRAAILESGTSLNAWSLVRNPREIATAIGLYLNVDTSTHESLVDGLRKVSYERLSRAQFAVGIKNFIRYSALSHFPYGPTIEPPSSNAVFTRYSHEDLSAGYFHRIPYLMGINYEEGLAFEQLILLGQKYLLRYDVNPADLVSPSFNIKDQFTENTVAHIIKRDYFGIIPVSLSHNAVVRFISDDAFNRPIIEAALLYSKLSPVYFYQFSYKNDIGHAGELSYLWRQSNEKPKTHSDKLTRKRMVRLWTNFAKTENPTPEKDPLLDDVTWPIANMHNRFTLKYLNINETLTTMINPKWEAFLYWTNLFKTYVLVFVDAQSDPPVVFLKNGLSVIGTVNKTVDENQIYYAFRGIPFAEAPLDDLRFRPPVPLPQNLSGHVIDATKDRSICIQLQMYPVQGSEDCLYINVYTPQFINVPTLFPVMVWIYGGGFYKGGSTYTSFGPDYLLEENVTIVTFNYRLGVYGFLSTEDYAAPGNYGLKDQVLALNWVQENIVYFGGDKTQVTIFGESAGAASVSYLSQSPLTKGLFRAAILESGTSLNAWSLVRNPTAIATAIGQYLNVDTSTHESLVNGLRKVSYKRLSRAQFAIGINTIVRHIVINHLPFGPTIEPPSSTAVFTQYSYEALSAGSFHRIPYLMGINAEEGLYFEPIILLRRRYLLRYDIKPTELVSPSFNIKNEFTKQLVAHIIKRHYFGLTPVSINTAAVIRFVSDDMFNRPITKAALLYSKRSPVYFYQFSYKNDIGHAQELSYLWRQSKEKTKTHSDKLTRKRMVRLWTNFAKTENPTPKKDPLLQDVTWPVANIDDTFSLKYLNINETLTTMIDPKWESFLFWTKLFNTYVIKDPAIIKAILVKDFNYFYDRCILSDEKCDSVSSKMLFFLKNPEWKSVRTKMTPVFTSGKMKNMLCLMNNAGTSLKKYIKEHMHNNSIESKELCAKFSTDVITSCAFGLEAGSFKNEDAKFRAVGRQMFDFQWMAAVRQTIYFLAPSLAKLMRMSFFDLKLTGFLRDVFWKTIEERNSFNRRNDLIDLIKDLRSQSDPNKSFTLDGDRIVAQATQFFAAGFETVSSTMAFTLYELSINPKIQQKLKLEIANTLAQYKEFSYDSIKSMKYLHMVICETLRKYPVLPFLDRRCMHDYKLPNSNFILKKGTPVYIPMLGLHHDPNHFPNPELYDPERFSDENKDSITSFTYIPFGEGPRNCIGERFGLLTTKVGVCQILSEFEVETCADTPVPIEFTTKSFFLASTVGIPLKFKQSISEPLKF